MSNPLVALIKRIKSKNETESGAELDDLLKSVKDPDDDESNDEYSNKEIEADVQKTGKFRSFFRRIKENAENAKNKLNDNIVEPAKHKANSIGNKGIDIKDWLVAKTKRKHRNHNVQHINQSIFNKDILFNTDKILEDTKQQAERQEVNVDDGTYITAAIENDLAELEKQKDKLLKEYKKTELEWDNLKEDKAIEKILKRASEKAAWLKENEEEREKGFDYTDEALKQARDDDDSDENKKLIESARQKHHAGIISRMSIIDGINQVFKDFHREKGEDQKAVSFATSENDAKIMQDAINNRYNYEALTQRAIKISLQRAKAKAAYLSANKGEKDYGEYVQEAFKGAKSALGGESSSFEAKPEYKDITKGRYEEIIAKAEQEYKNEQEEHAKAEKNRFNIDVRVQEGLGDLKKQKEELKDAANEETDENIKKYYQAKLEELAKQMAEKKLEIRRQVQQEEKAKADEEANRAQKAIDDAFTRAEANWEKKNQQQENQQSKNSSKKVDSKPKQSQEVAEKNVLDAFFKSIEPTKGKTISSSDSDLYDDDEYSPYGYSPSSSTELSEKDNAENYEKSKKALNNIRSVTVMHNIINSCIEYLKNEIAKQTVDIEDENVIKRLKKRHENRGTKRNQLQAINHLQKLVDSYFSFYGTSLAYYDGKRNELPELNKKMGELEDLKQTNPAEYQQKEEEYQQTKKEAQEISNASLGYVIGMSTLLDKLDASFVTTLNRFKGTDQETYIKKMREHLHAPLFRDVGTEYLLNHKMTVTDKYGNTIKDENGEDKLFNAYVQKNNSYGHSLMRSNSSTKATIGNCFRAIIRTMKNIINAQTYLDKNASKILKGLTSKCDETLHDNPHKFDVDKVKRTIGSILDARGIYDEQIRKLAGNSAGRDPSNNANKLSELLDLLAKLQKNPSDTNTITDIKTKLKKINDFSGLSSIIRDQSTESRENFSRYLFEDYYEPLQEKKYESPQD